MRRGPGFNPLPYPIEESEWKDLERGLVQRAELLNRMLSDLYGQQMLLRGDLLPPELVLAHPGFLRPLHGFQPGRFVVLYAADVVRNIKGEWEVLRDATQAPRGLGLAMENRITQLRMIPEIYQGDAIHRYQPFITAMRRTLAAMAPRGGENPRMALLTPGPGRDSYAEHLYLARALNLTLAECSDLTVRANQVLLKTLGGLQPLDVVLRGVVDSDCDPLEMNHGAGQGVPGLVRAVRAGNAAVANALGSGLVESPAIMPYLPQICRSLLKEELRIPSIATIHGASSQFEDFLLTDRAAAASCGDAPAGSRWHGWLLRRAAKDRTRGERGAAILTAEETAVLRTGPRRDWWNVVAQAVPECSTAPVLRNDIAVPRAVALRFYVLATAEGYIALPGGQARYFSSANDIAIGAAPEFLGDICVFGDSPIAAPNLLQIAYAPVTLARSGMDMPSRVADNLYWLGRYAERAEFCIRVLRTIITRLIGDNSASGASEIAALAETQAALGRESSGLDLSTRIYLSVYEDGHSGGLRAAFAGLRRNAATVRDRLSLDAWRVLGKLDYMKPQYDDAHSLPDTLQLLNELMLPLAAFSGVAMESMTRGPAWRFMDIGRRVERAMQMAALLKLTLAKVHVGEPGLMQALLEITESAMTYRSRYLSSIQVHAVIDLLLKDETNPRSIAFQADAIQEHLRAIAPVVAVGGAAHGEEERITQSLQSAIAEASVENLARETGGVMRANLLNLLMALERDLPLVSDAISRHYFTHVDPPQQVAGGWEAGATP